MFLLKHFKDFLVIQCTNLFYTHYKVDLHCMMNYFGHKYFGVKCDKVVDFFHKSDQILGIDSGLKLSTRTIKVVI